MGQYANTVNAYAMSAARAKVYTMQNTLQSYGQTSYMLNVSTAKFRRDIEAKKVKFIENEKASLYTHKIVGKISLLLTMHKAFYP